MRHPVTLGSSVPLWPVLSSPLSLHSQQCVRVLSDLIELNGSRKNLLHPRHDLMGRWVGWLIEVDEAILEILADAALSGETAIGGDLVGILSVC